VSLPTSASTDALIDMLEATWASVADLAAALTPEEWRTATDCPGWDVRSQVAHLVGTESMLAGRPTPEHPGEYPAHARNDIGRFNEHWIADAGSLSDEELLARFRDLAAERVAALRQLPPEDWEKEGPTPVGQAPYRRFMEIRVFDCWAHEQDIRIAVGRPGHEEGPAVDRSVDEVAGALGFLMGKRAGLPDGTSIRFAVGGRTFDVLVEGRARLVDRLEGDPTATVSTDAVTFVRLGCGRLTGPAAIAEGRVQLGGDPDAAERAVGSLAFTI
jgi:uncharacterized protein (TIGR03083 family)